MKHVYHFLLFFLMFSCISCRTHNTEGETFAPLSNGQAPQTIEELWDTYDPRKEPLETEILYEWMEDGVVMRVLRYRVGIFKGQKAFIAAVYGFPTGAKNLPGLVQVHGGGQYADYRAVLTNAKRGYATISISWAGRINAPDYKVNPEIVKLFWDNKTEDPNYKLTTDWGAIDAYHAPSRYPGNNSMDTEPGPWTLDSVESPRNTQYFLWALAARRAITFLEQQAEVDAGKLGIYGHSMGAKITVMTAGTDKRVKAAAPSCGGISNNMDNPLYQKTIADVVYLQHISCPIIFLSPANDFHGHLGDLPAAVGLIKTKEWRVVTSPHHSHQDLSDAQVSGLLWFDQHLKGEFTFPETPACAMKLNNNSGIPSFTVDVDTSKPILDVDIYYTQQIESSGEISERENRKNRFWHHAKATRSGNKWIAYLPLLSTDKPLWAYANVHYALDKPITGAGYYYKIYTAETFNISTLVQKATSDELKEAGVKNTMKTSAIIETFEEGWEKEWFTYQSDTWERTTHKLYDDKWKAPENAKLALGVRSEEKNKMTIEIDGYRKDIQLNGGFEWQEIVLSPNNFINAEGKTLEDWTGILKLTLGPSEKSEKSNSTSELNAGWQGMKPEFRNLQWKTD